ncbi:MAG: FMN-binding protein [Oscillospiraceae bacterium]|nr:FMN-binding protein [Oscillospiraceae bacterium]
MKAHVKFALRLAGTLTAIAVVVAGLLGLVNNVTKDKIAEANRVKTENAMMEVVEISNPSFSDALAVSDEMVAAAGAYGAKVVEFYQVTDGDAAAGYAVKVSASGSQGTIVMMVGVNVDGAVSGVSVISHSETSNIGTKITDNEALDSGVGALDQFKGLTMPEGGLAVGGDVDAITGATVTTKGVTKGVNGALAAVAAMQA